MYLCQRWSMKGVMLHRNIPCLKNFVSFVIYSLFCVLYLLQCIASYTKEIKEILGIQCQGVYRNSKKLHWKKSIAYDMNKFIWTHWFYVYTNILF